MARHPGVALRIQLFRLLPRRLILLCPYCFPSCWLRVGCLRSSQNLECQIRLQQGCRQGRQAYHTRMRQTRREVRRGWIDARLIVRGNVPQTFRCSFAGVTPWGPRARADALFGNDARPYRPFLSRLVKFISEFWRHPGIGTSHINGMNNGFNLFVCTS
ncbi:hypothetical protein MPH_01769 [Macrophomina phaseolina MS6]|uniref:Secreted protein n=1 Tax=Macrophomina phaseolina (strain MS6) TaxID=1126212 RepID=K2SWF1_MACPH|nr:hypothetical protein MPH_01769 [Macrophomina phaseolina MS6]